MIARIAQFAKNGARDLDRAQGGAILLLVLAGFLILVLASLTMFDAGQAARDKMELQTAADAGAYSQAVVKARTMNMVAYANTSKRVFYAYTYTYMAAWMALIGSWLEYKSKCFRWLPDLYACYRWGIGLAQIIVQGIELIFVQDFLRNDLRKEVQTLDNYQEYMVGITPWWSYAENMFRGTQNGATITSAWPPPPATVSSALNFLDDLTQTIDGFFDTSFFDLMPERSGKIDSMPLEKRSGVTGHGEYCVEHFGSLEHIMASAEHYMRSSGGVKGISTDSQTRRHFFLQALNPLNCIFASAVTGDAVLDWRIDGGMLGALFGGGTDDNDWMQATSNVTLAYQAGGHRAHYRAQHNRILEDHREFSLYEAEGYWALSRAEFFYGDSPASTSLNGLFPGMGSVMSRLSAGPATALIGGPNMWTPRWTAKLRPMHLPGEVLGSTNRGRDVGLRAILLDVAPHLAVTGAIAGLLDSNFSYSSALHDVAYLYIVSGGYSGANLQGLPQ